MSDAFDHIAPLDVIQVETEIINCITRDDNRTGYAVLLVAQALCKVAEAIKYHADTISEQEAMNRETK